MSAAHRRCRGFIDELDGLIEADATPDVVCELVSKWALTYEDFRVLDETPHVMNLDHFTEWHRRLRVARNDPTNDLFDRLVNR